MQYAFVFGDRSLSLKIMSEIYPCCHLYQEVIPFLLPRAIPLCRCTTVYVTIMFMDFCFFSQCLDIMNKAAIHILVILWA